MEVIAKANMDRKQGEVEVDRLEVELHRLTTLQDSMSQEFNNSVETMQKNQREVTECLEIAEQLRKEKAAIKADLEAITKTGHEESSLLIEQLSAVEVSYKEARLENEYLQVKLADQHDFLSSQLNALQESQVRILSDSCDCEYSILTLNASDK